MFDTGFHADFDKLRFPLRLTLFTLGVAALALVSYAAGGADIGYAQLLASVVLVVAFCALGSAILYLLRNPVGELSAVKGLIISWLLLVAVAFLCAFAVIFAHELRSFGINVFNAHVTPPIFGYALIGHAVLVVPFILWLEKKIHSDRIAQMEMESEQFTNLDFRIRPHFLFNSLNSVASLITEHPVRAETALHNLSDVFRAVMSDKRKLVPLKAELDMADKYLYLEKIRLGKRLQVSSKIDPNCVGVKVPVFLLQPMLENAVYHGIETRFKGGKINLVIQIKDKQLEIKITNPLPEAGVKRRVGNKVAQQNLRQRIQAIFGNKASLDSFEAETTFNVIVRLPL